MLELQNVFHVTGIVRDVLLILILAFLAVALIVVYRKVMSVLNSADATLKSAKEITDSIAKRFSEPSPSESTFFGFITRLFGRLRRRDRSDDD